MPTKQDSLILSIETATRAGSLAISRGNEVLASYQGDMRVSHSMQLLEQIKVLLAEAGVSLSDIDVFAVAKGPGSFTGLRIGLATAKSFAATLDRPCLGVPTLHAVAHAAGESERTVALLQAGRGEVFAQQFSVFNEGKVEPLNDPTHVRPSALLDEVASYRRLKWTGEGANLYSEAIRERALVEGITFRMTEGHAASSIGDQWTLFGGEKILAASVAQLALAADPFGENAHPQNLKAIYVRPSDAEINEQC